MTYWDGTRWIPEDPPPSPRRSGAGRRLLGASTEAGLITLLVFGLIAGSALAAPGGGKGAGPSGGGDGAGFSLVMVEDLDANGRPNYSDTVTFAVSTTATDKPHVNVRCVQDGALVYDGWAGFYPSAWFGRNFTLSSATWLGGGADCTARLIGWGKNGRERVLAEQPFRVDA